MPGFLITYNRRTGSAAVSEYLNSSDAMRERARLDLVNTGDDIEHVVVVSDSLDDIKVTHSRYFLRRDSEIRPISA